MDWLDAHQGSVLVLANVVLVLITGYYAWTTRELVRHTRATLQASARTTLQARLDRIGEIFLSQPELYAGLDDPRATGQELDARWHVTAMLIAVFEEAHTQYAIDHTMPEDEWRAWLTTADRILRRRYVAGYWDQTRDTFGAPFRAFMDARLKLAEAS